MQLNGLLTFAFVTDTVDSVTIKKRWTFFTTITTIRRSRAFQARETWDCITRIVW
jgi:hypothetical protein